MIRYKSLHLRGTAVSAAVIFLFSSACLVSEIAAQSAVTGSALSSPGSPVPAPFLVAPAIPLGYAPSSVATGDLRRSGKLDLVTADYNSGKVTVFLGAGQGKFAPGVEYDAGPHPSAVLVADMNGDGRPDVVVSNESDGTISVLLGKGEGTLQPRQSYAIGFNPSCIATGDFNGSGRLDLAVAGKSGNLLAVLLNDGNGNLQKPILRSLSKTPMALTVADFNNDGHADLALANTDGTVSILLGKGAGLFRSLPDVSVASGSLSSIESGDLNKDGKMDLIVTQPGQKLVSVLPGKGDGTFASPASYPVGNEPVATLVADVNGDGVPALVVINKSSNTFSILGGNGDGTFKSSVDFVAGNAPLAVVAGDFYGDGHVDLAIINHSSQTVSVPLGNGDGTFKAARSYSAGVQPVSVASGNLNGGKIPALVVANYCGSDLACSTAGSVAVFLADDKGVYRLSSTYTVGAGPVSVALADLKGDRNLDIVALNRLDKSASVLLGLGDGTFRRAMTFSLGGAPIAVIVADLNKDGKPDLAVLEDCGSAKCSQAGSVEILLGGGDGSFQSVASYPVGYSPVSFAVGAIHGGKNLDLVVANRYGNDASCQSAGTATVLLGDGTGKFTLGTDIALGNSPSSIALGNLAGSSLDLVVSRSTDDTVAVLHGNGDGTFQAAVPYAVGNNPGSLVVADFNGDGKADVAVANVNDSTVSVLFGKGNGTLQPAGALAVGNGPTSLTAVGRATGRHASLATTNGSGGSSSPGTEFTVLPNLGTDPPLVSFVLVPSPTPASNVNDSVLLTATLTGVTPNLAPSGTVTFFNGATALSDCTGVSVTQGVSPSLISTATCTTQMLTAGTDSLTAVYSGDAIYDTGVGETSPAVTQTVSQLSPALVLSGQGTSQVNQAVTFTATLGSVAFTPIAPGGTVTFTAGGNPISDCPAVTVNATTLAPTCTTSTLAAGSDLIGAAYTGDSNYNGVTATAVTQTVSKASPTLVLSGQGTSQVNQAVTFTATLGGVTFTPTAPGGKVSFTVNGNPTSDCPAVTVNATTLAPTCTTAKLAVGSDSIGASYTGDSNYATVTATAVTQTVSQLTPTLVLSGQGTSQVNQAVTFTATLGGVTFTPTAPGGKVSFTVNGNPTSDCPAVTVNATTLAPTCTTAKLAVGSDSIGASYTGDSNYAAVTATAVTQTVSQLTPTLVMSGQGATKVNQHVTFKATLGGVTFTPTAPSGTITFTVGGNPISDCSPVTVNATTLAPTCSTATLPAGSDSIGASYSGDSSYAAVTATPVTQTVVQLSPSLVLSGEGSSQVNQQVTFTATLGGVAFTPTAPSGTVTFTSGGNPISDCPAVTVNATTLAPTCATSTLSAGSDSIRASYSGDGNYKAVTAGAVTQTVSKLAPTLTLSGQGSSNVNQQVTFTATVGGVTFTPTAPSGKVTFTSGGNPISDCPAVTVNASTLAPTCATSTLAVGSDSIGASYSGDINYKAVTATSVTQTVSPVAATLSLTASPGVSVAAGTLVTFTAQVGPAGSITPAAPTGTVTFLINGSASTDCPAVTLTSASAGAATCKTSSLLVPADVITATYSGDNNFTGPVTTTLTETVGKTAAQTTLTSSLPTSSVNQPVTFTATVKPPSGTVLPTGSVTFTQGATTLCGATVISNTTGIATCSYAFSSVIPTPGSTITATYSGDQSFSAGTPATVSQVVTAASTTTSVVSSPNPSTTNQQVAFTATVTPAFTAGTAKPTGKVTFTDTTSSTNLCANLTITAGIVPVCNYTFTAAGTYDVVATYTSGDSNFTGSASGATADAQVVSAGGTSVTLTSSPSPSFVDQTVTFNATINFTSSGSTVPTGTVVYYDGASALCTFPSNGNTKFTGGVVPACAVSLSSAGTHSITAAFTSSDSNFSNRTSNALSQVVSQTATTTTVVSTPNPSNVNQSVAFTATVTPQYTAGTALPTGKVTFTNTTSSTTLCANLTITTAGAVPVCNYTFTTAGSYNVVATYTSGDSNFAGSSSAADVQAVGAGTTSVALTSQPSPSTVNQQVTVTATLSFISSGSAVPTGKLSYTDTLTSKVLCTFPSITATGSGSGNVPACTAPFYTAGTHPISVSYGGDSNFSKSSSTLNLIVSPTATATSVSGPTSSAVNQPVTFTATIAPAVTPFAGSTNPTGTVSFSYVFGGVNVPLCTTSIPVSTAGTGAGAVTTAACSASLPSQGAYTISAIYTGDSNFSTSTSAAFPLQVGATATTVALTNSLAIPPAVPPPSIATQPVTFVATVSQAVTGGTLTSPTGTITFSSSDGTLGTATGQLCGVVPLIAAVGGTATATCAVQFPATTGGAIAVSAAYSGDKNFNGSSTPAPITQVVENFGLVFTAPVAGTPAALVPVLLTQGYSNASDPFNATKITATLTTQGGYTDHVNFTCTVTDTSTNAPVTDPSCSVSPTFLSKASSGASLTYTVSASTNAPVGSYAVSLAGSDAAVPTLSHTTTPPVTVYVLGVSTALTLAPGATGTANNAIFDTAAAPAGDKLQTFACGAIVPFTNGKPGVPLTGTGYLTCTGPATTVTGFQTTVPISITPVEQTAQLQRSSTIALAAFLGIPLLALLGWVGDRKSPRRNFFRFIGLILLVVGLSYATGCGTGFTPPATPPGSKLAGSYYVQVVATDGSGAVYYAVVPLTVNQ